MMDAEPLDIKRDENGYVILPNGAKVKSFPTTIYTAEDGKEIPIFWSHYIPANNIKRDQE
jgi:hypothetical protein